MSIKWYLLLIMDHQQGIAPHETFDHQIRTYGKRNESPLKVCNLSSDIVTECNLDLEVVCLALKVCRHVIYIVKTCREIVQNLVSRTVLDQRG